MFCRSLIVLFLFVAIFSLILTPLYGEEVDNNNRFMVVLDASGSMWGQISKKTKIEIAREVIGDLVKDWDQQTQVGLVAYGHRKKGDCGDIEVISPLGPIDKAGFTKAVNKLTPKGMTPLSDAVVKAAETLKYTEQKATVILVSDGIETCDKDPCAIATKLEGAGVDFTTHVIGFDVADVEQQKQLECLAANTGGSFYSADNADSLKSALSSAVQETVEVDKPKTTALTVATVFEPGGPIFTDVYYQFYHPESGSRLHPGRVRTEKDGALVYKVEPGEYRVKVTSRKGTASTEKVISISESDELREEFVIAQEADIKLFAVNSKGSDPIQNVYWSIFDQKGVKVAYGKGDTPTYRLLAGDYKAKVRTTKGEAETEHAFTVASGENQEIEVLIAQEGLLKLAAVIEEGGEALEGIYWTVYQKPASALSDKKRVKYGSGSNPEYQLLPGEYVVEAKSTKGKAVVEQEVVVTAGERNEVNVMFPAEGEVVLVAVNQAGGDPIDSVYFSVYEPAKSALSDPKRVAWGGGNERKFRLLPGKYLVEAKSTKGQAKVEQEITVPAGDRVRTEILLPEEGRIELVALIDGNKEPISSVYWTVYDIPKLALNDPRRVTSSGSAKPSFQLLPGKYRIQAKNNKSKEVVEKEVEVLAGKVLKGEFVFESESADG